MSRPTALQAMRIALQQYHVMESPAGSNNVKYNTAYYGHPVREDRFSWCAAFSWWCGWVASGKEQSNNPLAKNANAAYIQDETVRNKGGHYILAQTSSNARKRSALSSYRFGDEISFNFSGGSSRVHTGLIVGVVGSNIYCIEGNTSFDNGGSQSNGGCVALRKRSYTTGVCVVRPSYTPFKWHKPNEPYHGHTPALPRDGSFTYRDKGAAVKVLQNALAWANGYDLKADGVFGSHTFAEVVIFQVSQGLTPDGVAGAKTVGALKRLINAHKTDGTNKRIVVTTKVKKTRKTKAERLVERALLDAWPYGTPKRKYKYPTGKPRKQYRRDLVKYCPERKHWSTRPEHGRSCDVAVCVIVRATIDRHFPRGHDEQGPYMAKSPKYKRVKKAKPGDIIWQVFDSGARHVSVKTSKNRVYNAHYNANTYPVIEKLSAKVRPKSKCKQSKIYRPV